MQAEYFQYRHSPHKIPIQNIFSNNHNEAYFFRFFSTSHCSMPFLFVHMFNNKSRVSLLFSCCAINRRVSACLRYGIYVNRIYYSELRTALGRVCACVHHDYSFVIWSILNVSDFLRAQSQTTRNAILDRAAHDHKTGLVHGERYRAHVVESITHGASHSEE